MVKFVNSKKSQAGNQRARFATLSAEQQALLLDPAEAEFAEHGFERASLNRILSTSGMSKGQAYYYISDKADLYRVVVERGLERIGKAIDSGFSIPKTANEFWQQMAGIFHQITEVLQKDKTLAAVACGIYEGPGARVALTEPLEMIRRQSDKLIAIGQSVGAIRTDLPQTFLFEVLFATVRAVDQWFAEHWSTLGNDAAYHLNDLALEMIKAMALPAEKTLSQ